MSLFTVEQLELIRRLRSTGISAQQVQEAFNQLAQLDVETSCSSADVICTSYPLPQTSSADSDSAVRSPVLLQQLKAQPPVPLTISAASPVCSSPERISVQTVPAASSVLESNAGGRPIRSQRTPINDIIVLDDPAELDEFMQQGEEGCISDMKLFINQYSLRQTTVAMMTGVSQPYISKLLNGNHRELSLRCRKNIYCWYLNCRKHPEKLASFLADPSTRLETNGEGELVPQRRERYVFRPILIRMLEGFFAQTPFPDISRRMEIAAACNHVLQLEKKGVGLMPKEIVSPQVVANWFANKRKEIRRRSNENQDRQSNPPASTSANGLDSSVQQDENSSGCETTPSPSMEDVSSNMETSQSSLEPLNGLLQQPMDMLAIASRFGLTFPCITTSVETSMPTLTSNSLVTSSCEPISTLASQLMNNHQFQLNLSALGLKPSFPTEGLELNNLFMPYDPLRAPLVKSE